MLTVDNGPEFCEQLRLEELTDLQIWFVRPYYSGDRGTKANENDLNVELQVKFSISKCVLRLILRSGRHAMLFDDRFPIGICEWKHTALFKL